MRRLLAWAWVVAASGGAVPAVAQGRAGVVSLAEGSAQLRRDPGIPRDLHEGSPVEQGDVVETGDDSRIELKLRDSSLVRLGEHARLALTEARFERGAVSGRRQLSVRLHEGKLWAKAVPAEGGDRSFQIATENAVASARGAAVFRLDAHRDRSILLRVYSGTVAIRGEPGSGAREGWEKLIQKEMQILVSPEGTPGVPAPFTGADEQGDDWAAWNRKRDGRER